MDPNHPDSRTAYWKKNTSLVIKLLIVWFVVSFGCGIILVEPLNTIQIGGYKLGFWFAQQGSIYTFVALTFYYSYRMKKIDRDAGLHERDENGE